MKKIYYAPFMEASPQMGWYHPLFEEEVYIPIQPYLSYYKHYQLHSYWRCPAWQHYWKSAFVIFSQMDIRIEYDKATGVVTKDSFRYIGLDEGVPPKEIDGRGIPKPYHGVVVGQIHQYHTLWSESRNKDLWVEIVSPPNFAEKGIEIITAEFPIRWPRPMVSACRFNNAVTEISRGEPIGILRFKNFKNPNDSFSLTRKEAPDRMKIKSHNLAKVKDFLPGKSWEVVERKCPFFKSR